MQSGSAPVDRRDKPVNGDGRYDPVGQELRHGEGGVIQPLPAPDIFIDGAPHDTRFIAGPCHGRAADWMRVSISPSAVWAGEGVVVEDVDFQDFSRPCDAGRVHARASIRRAGTHYRRTRARGRDALVD